MKSSGLCWCHYYTWHCMNWYKVIRHLLVLAGNYKSSVCSHIQKYIGNCIYIIVMQMKYFFCYWNIYVFSLPEVTWHKTALEIFLVVCSLLYRIKFCLCLLWDCTWFRMLVLHMKLITEPTGISYHTLHIVCWPQLFGVQRKHGLEGSLKLLVLISVAAKFEVLKYPKNTNN